MNLTPTDFAKAVVAAGAMLAAMVAVVFIGYLLGGE